MSELEKQRAISLVAILTLALGSLFVYQSRDAIVQHSGVRDGLELCAASKGALCEEAPDETLAGSSGGADIAEAVHDLGQIVVIAPRASVGPDEQQIAFLGALTVTAPRA